MPVYKVYLRIGQVVRIEADSYNRSRGTFTRKSESEGRSGDVAEFKPKEIVGYVLEEASVEN